MKKFLAVSGGIDSVVMLYLMRNDKSVVVLHFDHGIRPSSAEDCEFVKRLAKQYGLPFISEQAKLGEDCSEERARKERYAFFKAQLKEPGDKIYTAHHRDDLLESAIINLFRGTGWRGLAPLRDKNLCRPLLNMSKADIYKIATENKLSFRLDQSNSEDKYLRNRIRQKLLECPLQDKQKLVELAIKQRLIADEIDELLETAFPKQGHYSRSIFKETDEAVALEILRHVLRPEFSLTRPQLERALEAIRNFQPGKRFSLSKDGFLLIKKYNFTIEQTGVNLHKH